MSETKFTSSRTFLVLIHTLSWLIVFAIPSILQAGNGEKIELEHFLRPSYIIFHVNVVVLFYFNAFFLVPRVMYKKGTLLYVFSTLGFIILFSLLVMGTAYLFPAKAMNPEPGHEEYHHHYREFFFFSLLTSLFVCAFSTSYRIIRDRARTEKQLKERENEHLKSELTFLRSQVSPHFMFNVLNNIVSLSRKKSDMVEPVVIKLSHLMRYMLYESDEDKVSLEKEVDYLQSYIDLQMLRFGEDVKLNMDIPKNISFGSIEPMLLIPFVENAFKHGVVMIDQPEIDIAISSTADQFVFSVKNKFNEKIAEEKDKNSGIGLNNVKRRLNLLYKDNHALSVKKNGNWFFVELRLNLR